MTRSRGQALDASNVIVDVGPAQTNFNHTLADGLQSERPKLRRRRFAVPVAEILDRCLNRRDGAGAFAVRQVIALGEPQIAAAKNSDGDRFGGRRRRGPSLHQPLGDESVVERLLALVP